MDVTLTTIKVIALIFAVGQIVSSITFMIGEYRDVLERVTEDMHIFPPLFRRVQQILQEHGTPNTTRLPSSTSIPCLTATLTSAVDTYSEFQRVLSEMNHDSQSAFMKHIKRVRGYRHLDTLATRLQGHKNSLNLIITLIPRAQAALEIIEKSIQENISSPDMSCFSAVATQRHLETIFSPSGISVVHSLTGSYPALTTATAEWTDLRIVGGGANGTTVTLQSGPSGLLRVVKRVVGPAASYAKEIDALSRVSDNSELFVQFLGWYAGREFLYIAMEFIEKGDLSTFIKLQGGSPLLEGTCREITRQVLEGIRVLHERDICHRDLKPENILVAALDPIHVKITDFGVSKYLANTECRTMVGTVGYIAPELLGILRTSTQGSIYGYPADLWAMGCIVYELLSLRRPFDMIASDESKTDVVSGVLAQITTQLDMPLLIKFCYGKDTRTIEALMECGASVDAMDVVKALLRPDPSERLSASQALELPWFANPGEATDQRRTEVLSNSLSDITLNEIPFHRTTTGFSEVSRPPLDTISE